jgi:copper homeostasis protein
VNQAVLFEACVDSVEAALAAQEGGANRLELCADLLEGGITPSGGMMELVRRRLTLPLHVLIRPRGGDFCYSDLEFETMQLDIERAKQLHADGVAIGILEPDGSIDLERSRALVALARPMSVTFHRAFDMSRDPYRSLQALMDLGVDRVLTSGQEASAWEGVRLIASLVQQAKDRIVVMAGGGITERNAGEIVGRSGVSEIHATARVSVDSRMQYRNLHCSMGGALRPPDYGLSTASSDRVRAFVNAVRR